MNLYVSGESVPLVVLLEDGASDQYPLASVYRNGTLEASVDLTHQSIGRYRGMWTPSTIGFYDVLYRVYTDPSRTLEGDYGRQVESWRGVEDLAVPIADAVLREQIADHVGVSGSLAETVDQLETRLTAARAANLDLIPGVGDSALLARKCLTNRLELAEGDTNNWVLYDDDDATPLLTWNVRDYTGQGIRLAAYGTHRRWPQ